MYKNRKHPGTFQTGDIKYVDVMTKNLRILWDVMNKGCNESRDILIQGHFIKRYDRDVITSYRSRVRD